MIMKISGGRPGDLLISRPSPSSPAPNQPAAQSANVSVGTQRASNTARAPPPVRAQVRWNMVFTWQAPMMLLSYSLIAFVMGLTICVLTPLFDGRDYDDNCKVCEIWFLFLIRLRCCLLAISGASCEC